MWKDKGTKHFEVHHTYRNRTTAEPLFTTKLAFVNLSILNWRAFLKLLSVTFLLSFF